MLGKAGFGCSEIM